MADMWIGSGKGGVATMIDTQRVRPLVFALALAEPATLVGTTDTEH